MSTTCNIKQHWPILAKTLILSLIVYYVISTLPDPQLPFGTRSRITMFIILAYIILETLFASINQLKNVICNCEAAAAAQTEVEPKSQLQEDLDLLESL